MRKKGKRYFKFRKRGRIGHSQLRNDLTEVVNTLKNEHTLELKNLKREVQKAIDSRDQAEIEARNLRDQLTNSHAELENKLRSMQIRGQEEEFKKYERSLGEFKTKIGDKETEIVSYKRVNFL